MRFTGNSGPSFVPSSKRAAGRARHTNTINTLFGDGRVEALSPDAINPKLTDAEYWTAELDRK
jgi:prepilin-type processing-associated H-X9-DG protein